MEPNMLRTIAQRSVLLPTVSHACHDDELVSLLTASPQGTLGANDPGPAFVGLRRQGIRYTTRVVSENIMIMHASHTSEYHREHLSQHRTSIYSNCLRQSRTWSPNKVDVQ